MFGAHANWADLADYTTPSGPHVLYGPSYAVPPVQRNLTIAFPSIAILRPPIAFSSSDVVRRSSDTVGRWSDVVGRLSDVVERLSDTMGRRDVNYKTECPVFRNMTRRME